MLKHIVVWKLKDTPEKAHLAQGIKTRLEGLVGQVPSLRRVEVGINLFPGEQVADVSLYSEFDDEAGLRAYLVHPAHEEAAKFIRSVVAERKVCDYVV